jgi:DNA-binding NarL/FixJ family response regulator
MNEVINILMVEDEKAEVDQYLRLAEEQEGMNIVYSTGSESRALTFMKRCPVDVVILDLELEEGDGISLLAAMEEQNLQPFTVVVTNTVSNVTLSYVRMHGADYVYRKMNGAYTPERVLSTIQKIFPYQRFRRLPKEHPIVERFNRETREVVIRNNLEQELKLMGMKRMLTGFDYLVEAVMLYRNRPEETVYLTGEIYPEIADRYHVTSASVEKAIRGAIESAFMFADIRHLQRYYPFPYNEELGRPTNLQFISNMAKRMEL